MDDIEARRARAAGARRGRDHRAWAVLVVLALLVTVLGLGGRAGATSATGDEAVAVPEGADVNDPSAGEPVDALGPSTADPAQEAAPTTNAGTGQYSGPEWLPLRRDLGGTPLSVGCTYQTGGWCGGHHSYWALDLGLGALGAPVHASGAGQVIAAGFQGGWGNYVRIDHGPFGDSLYAHLSRIDVSSGQWVDEQTLIGAIGQTGTATTPHLHYEYYDVLDAPSDEPGVMRACHGNTIVTYTNWTAMTGQTVHSDGTTCGVTLPDIATRFHAVDPARLLDSRAGPTNIGPYATPWGSGESRGVTVNGWGGVPVDADAVVLNVTVVNATADSFLQLWPNGAPQPHYGSSLNFSAGQVVANSVTVRVGDLGQVRVLNAAGSVDVVIDVAGYYRQGEGAGFAPVAPVRLLDSRVTSNVGSYATPWSDGPLGARDVRVAGVGGVPGDAVAVVLNVTAVNPTDHSFLQIWPSGAGQPTFGSSVNFTPGQIVPNLVTVKPGADGKVRLLNAHGSVDIVVDVTGYYTAIGGGTFHPILPDRVIDSRPGSNVGPFSSPWQAGWVRAVQVAGRGVVPAHSAGVVMNVTAVTPSQQTFVQLWPADVDRPAFGSNLNALPGQIVPNAVTVGLGYEGDVLVYNAAGDTDLVIDLAGYFT